MDYRKVNLNKNRETYELKIDDGCFLVKQGKNKVWLSMSMVDYLAEQKDREMSKKTRITEIK